MKLTLTGIASAVATAFSVADTLVEDFNVLKVYAVQFMDLLESAYEGAVNAGESKLQAVLAAVEAVASTKGITMGADLVAAITAFIGESKAAYNAVSASAVVGSVNVAPAVAPAAAA